VAKLTDHGEIADMVQDMSTDPRFCDHPTVRGTNADLYFYAGAPLTTETGIDIGTLFIMDTKPRINGLSEKQTKRLCHVLFRKK